MARCKAGPRAGGWEKTKSEFESLRLIDDDRSGRDAADGVYASDAPVGKGLTRVSTDSAKRLSKNGLNLWPTGACLMSYLISDLRTVSATSLERTCVVLPTGRLGTLLLASLAQAKDGAFIPPDVHTLESWVEALAARRPGRRRCLSEAGRSLLLSQIIETSGYGYLRAGHEAELNLLFRELDQEQLDARASLEALRAALLAESNRHESFLATCMARIDEIIDCFQKLRSELAAMGTETSHQNADAAYLIDHPEALNISGYERVIVAGFTSAAPALTALLKTFSERPGVEVWLSESPETLMADNPLKKLIAAFENPHHVAAQTSLPKDLRPRISACATKVAEVKTALASCARAIACGIAPSRVAILATNEQEYVDLIHAYGERSGLPLNIALSRGLHLYPIGSWFNLLTATLQEKKIAAFIRWLLHPYTQLWLSHELSLTAEDIASETSKAITALSSELDTRLFESQARLRGAGFSETPAWQTAFNFINLSAGRTRQSWDSHVQFVKDVFLAPLRTLSKNTLRDDEDLAHCLEAFDDYLQHILPVAATLSGETVLTTVLATIKKNLASIDVRHIGEPLHGVQVLRLAESRYYPFEHVVLLGANEGLFPKSMPQDELLDDYSKRLLGLPGWQALESREDVTFLLLQARIPSLHLIYAEDRLGEELIPSRYIELFAAKAQTVNISSQEKPRLYEGFVNEEEDQVGRVGADFSQKSLERFSASSLEALLQCPYRFLLLRSGVKPYALPKPWRDAREEGEWLHEVFEAFMKSYGDALQRGDAVAPLDLLKELTRRYGPDGITKTALYHHLTHFAFPRFLSYLKKLFARDGLKTIASGRRELFFGEQTSALRASLDDLPDLGAPITLHGKVDSVDFLEGMTLILDYKRKSLPRKDLAKVGASPQLSFYALALSKTSSKQLGIPELSLAEIATAYWSILDGELLVAASGATAVSAAATLGLCSTRVSKLEDVVTQMRELWQWRLAGLREAGRFTPDTSECGLCPYPNICRKADARYEREFRNRRALSSRLAAQKNAATGEVQHD